MGLTRARLRLLYLCLARFGIARGVRVWWTLRPRAADGGAIPHRAVSLPGYRQPIWLRPETSDIAAFERVFLRLGMEADSYPQHAQLVAHARKLGRRAVIVDGGANIGMSTIWFARAFPEATIFAVEPDAANVAMIRRNTGAYPNVVPVEAGLWDQASTLRIVDEQAAAWAYRVDESRSASTPEGIPAVTINELMQRAGAEELLIVKLIIEGAEKAVFRSNLDWLDRTRLVIFMPSDWAAPWAGAGRTAMAALARLPFDWIVRELCVFCYRDPATIAAQAPAAAAGDGTGCPPGGNLIDEGAVAPKSP